MVARQCWRQRTRVCREREALNVKMFMPSEPAGWWTAKVEQAACCVVRLLYELAARYPQSDFDEVDIATLVPEDARCKHVYLQVVIAELETKLEGLVAKLQSFGLRARQVR